MKKLISFALILLSTGIYAQDSKKIVVPEAVAKAFSKKFPKAKKVEWEKDNSNEFEAEFEKGDMEISVLFSEDGEWLKTETEIKPEDIPQAIIEAVSSEYEDYTLLEAEKIETSEGITYELEIESEGISWELEISPEGEIIDVERLEEELEEDEQGDAEDE